MGTAAARVYLEAAIAVMAGCRQCSATTKADYIDALRAIEREVLGIAREHIVPSDCGGRD